jgi:serine/threonine protein kinase
VLVDLVHVDIELRWKAGIGVQVEEYLARYPELASDSGVVADLAAWEFQHRRRSDPSVKPEEYIRRFPGQSDELADLLLANTAAGSGAPTYEFPPGQLPTSLPPVYECLEELGRGGMGVVLRARHRALDRVVAVKLIRADLSRHAAARSRFEAEARAIALLDHPGIVRVHDGGVHAGHPYLVMEYVPGGSLAGRLRHGPMGPREAAELVAQLARAVHHAHQRGIVHRDLKPANILMGEGPSATPRVTDFGLARQLSAGIQTVQGDLLGTPAYMAPEQATGRSEQIGPATDVFGLGAVLYECLTGRPPHQEATRDAALRAAARGEVESPRRLNPRVPARLEAICLKAMAADPSCRYPTAEALAEDLERWLSRKARLARLGMLSFALVAGAAIFGSLLFLAFKPPARPRPQGGEPVLLHHPRLLENGDDPVGVAKRLRGVLSFKVLTNGNWETVTRSDTRAVPVRNAEQIRVEAELSQPGYIYLLYHDGLGQTYPLYPWNTDGGFKVQAEEAPPFEEPVLSAQSPRPGMGYPLEGASSLDTVFLIASRSPLTQEDRGLLARQLKKLRGTKSTAPHEVFERDYSGGKLDLRSGWARNRGLKPAEVAAVDRPFDDVVLPIAQRVEVFKAIRFSHWGEEGEPPPPPEK